MDTMSVVTMTCQLKIFSLKKKEKQFYFEIVLNLFFIEILAFRVHKMYYLEELLLIKLHIALKIQDIIKKFTFYKSYFLQNLPRGKESFANNTPYGLWLSNLKRVYDNSVIE